MSNLYAGRAEFVIVGELMERRLVTSEKQKDWQLYILKLSGKACILEAQVSKEIFESAVKGEAYQVMGQLSANAGRTLLLAEKVELLTAVPRAVRTAS